MGLQKYPSVEVLSLPHAHANKSWAITSVVCQIHKINAAFVAQPKKKSKENLENEASGIPMRST